jgi:hypothetical protein
MRFIETPPFQKTTKVAHRTAVSAHDIAGQWCWQAQILQHNAIRLIGRIISRDGKIYCRLNELARQMRTYLPTTKA